MTDNKTSESKNCETHDALQDERDLFGQAIMEAMKQKFDKEVAEFENLDTSDIPPPSRRHQIRMNRLFRERVGGTFLPYPDADNAFERVRSKIVIKLKLNELIDKRKERKYSRCK